MTTYILYTDGACSGNPGPGGYGYILMHESKLIHSGSQGYIRTTNNRMELRGVIAGLGMTRPGDKIMVVTDSEYIVNSFQKQWIEAWQARGWKTAQKKPVANRDLWEALLKLTRERGVTFQWIRGHVGHEYNEQCDRLAVAASQSAARIEDEQSLTPTSSLF